MLFMAMVYIIPINLDAAHSIVIISCSWKNSVRLEGPDMPAECSVAGRCVDYGYSEVLGIEGAQGSITPTGSREDHSSLGAR